MSMDLYNKETLEIRKLIYNYCMTYFLEARWDILWRLCDIQAIELDEVLNVNLVTHAPGILIGKGGRDIIKLKEYLETFMERPIKINIHESLLFNFKKYEQNLDV